MLDKWMFREQLESHGSEVQSVLDAARKHLGMDIGFVSEFVEGRRMFRYASQNAEDNPVKVGHSDPLPESYCHYITAGLMPPLLQDSMDDPIAASMAVTRQLPVGAHLSAPVYLADGRLYGTFCCFSFAADRSLNERDLDVLRMCAEITANLVQEAIAREAMREAQTLRITEVIRKRKLKIVFQPVYRLANDQLLGFEALARFDVTPARPPDLWFAEAGEIGLGCDLEMLAVEEALTALARLPSNLSISLNLSPQSLASIEFADTFDPRPVDRVVLELTEHSAIDAYPEINAALAPYRARGMRLAIDDVGAGHSSFRHVLELRPDLIKLDTSLTRNLHRDPARRALADAITRFGREMGAEVIAEGVETVEELQSLRTIDATAVQGYLTGRPMPVAAAAGLSAYGSYDGAIGAARSGSSRGFPTPPKA
jgi:EAL domain-containing protein (putative c-di-GMP-specific phosphodiesterase class I)